MLVHLLLKFHIGILLGTFESSETTKGGKKKKNILSGVEHCSGYAYIRDGIYKAESGSDYLTAPLLSCRNL